MKAPTFKQLQKQMETFQEELILQEDVDKVTQFQVTSLPGLPTELVKF